MTGWIERRPSGARIRVRHAGKQLSFTVPAGDDPQEFRAEVVACLRGTVPESASKGSLNAWASRWLDARERTHRDAMGDRARWRCYVLDGVIERFPEYADELIDFAIELALDRIRSSTAVSRAMRRFWKRMAK